MSQIIKPGLGGGTPGIQTINGDVGSITGSTVTIYADNAGNNSGATVEFVNSGSVSTLNVTDGSSNTLVGSSSGGTVSGNGNTGLGAASLQILQGGSGNCALGQGALDSTSSGDSNIGIGVFAGDNFSGSESSNILLNSLGQSSDNNVLRIGQTTGTGNQQLNSAYIQGIYSNNQPVGGTIDLVTIDNTTGQLGVTTSAGAAVTLTDDFSATVTSANINLITNLNLSDGNFSNCGSSVSFNADSSTLPNPSFVLQTSDVNQNTIIGSGSGNTSISGNQNAILGASSFTSATTDRFNSCLGYFTLPAVTGNAAYNVAVGYGAGQSYTGGETSNILLSNSGVTGENNAMRLGGSTGTGSFGIINTYVCGIWSQPQSQSPGVYVVTVNSNAGSSQDMLGTTTIQGTISWSDKGADFTAHIQTGYFITAALTSTLPTSPVQGDTISFAVDTSGTFVIQASPGQSIRIGANISTVAGTATNSSIGDSITLVYRASDTTWISVTAPQGTWFTA